MLKSLEAIGKDAKKEAKTVFGREVRTYTDTFRKEVVVFSDNHTGAETAKNFGIPAGTVSTWRSQARRDKLNIIGDKDNVPNSKPTGARKTTTPMPTNRHNPKKPTADKPITTAEKELMQLSEKLWEELAIIENAIALLRAHKK